MTALSFSICDSPTANYNQLLKPHVIDYSYRRINFGIVSLETYYV